MANIQVQYLLLVHDSSVREMHIFKTACDEKINILFIQGPKNLDVFIFMSFSSFLVF